MDRDDAFPQRRRAVRRAVQVECDVLSEQWDEPVPLLATDLSPFGLWLETPFPLEVGEELVLSFTPPNLDDELVAMAEVRRVALRRRRTDPPVSGMGIAFTDVEAVAASGIEQALEGLPPPLPRARPAVHRELVFEDEVVTLCEELGDQVNDVELIEAIGMVVEEDLSIEPLGELLTGGFRLAG
jgi:hypothetical protein